MATKALFWVRGILLAVTLSLDSATSLNTLNYQILEELVPGTVIANIVGDAHLADDYQPSELYQLRFSLLSRDHDDVASGDYFAIDPTSGIVRIASAIDRDSENLCAFQKTCYLNFDVFVSPALYFRVINVKVEILDINDNAPVFSRTEYRLNISETALAPTTYNLPSVFDRDSTDFGIRNVELRPDDEHFQIVWSQDLKGHVQPKLRLMKQLDREEDPAFDLTVVAYDGGSPPNSADLVVHVVVLDTNDNSPVFDLPVYEARINENAAIGTPVLAIHAADPDAGAGGTVEYSLSAQTLGERVTKFRIDPTSGEIYLAEEVDREEKEIYDLQVIAKDGAKDQRQASAPLTIHISDVNDNPPVIRISVITTSGRAEVSESAQLGTFVALISVTDKDWGQNSEITCSLRSEKFGMQIMQPNSKFKVVTEGRLDREEKSLYDVYVYCEDKGVPTLSSSETFSVHVTDVNDHAPVFTRQQYIASVEENRPAGTDVIRVETTDDDVGENAMVTYTLVNDDEGRFSIDANSGMIRTRVPFDYEQSPERHLTVEARDRGQPPMSSTSGVLVRIIDVNDLAPEFSQSSYTFSVKENQLSDTLIGRLSAVDKDTGNNKKFVFSIDSEEAEVLERFAIRPDNGSLILLKALDREKKPFYHLTIWAKDIEPPGLSSSATVIIHVQDVNDNAPIVDFPSNHNNTALISNRLPPGYKVTQIRAHDPDVGDNAQLNYFIVQDDGGKQRFGVDPKSGEVFLNYDLSEVKAAAYHVTILVKDNGTPERSTYANLTVLVNQSAAIYDTQFSSDNENANNKNMLIIIIVVAISGVIIIVLLVSIVFVLLTSRKKRANESAAAASIVMDTVDADNSGQNGAANSTAIYSKTPAIQSSINENDVKRNDHQRYVTLSNQSSLNLSNNAACIDRNSSGCLGTGSKPPVPPRGVLMNYTCDQRKPDMASMSRQQAVGSPRRSPEEIDRQSAASSEDSITDSGRGASEEGENGEDRGAPRLPPKLPFISSTRRQPLLPKLSHPGGIPRRLDSSLSLEYPPYFQSEHSPFRRYQGQTGTGGRSNSLSTRQTNPSLSELLLKPDFGLSQIQNEFDPHYRLKYRDFYHIGDTLNTEEQRTPANDGCGNAPIYEEENSLSGPESLQQNKQTVRSIKAKDRFKKQDGAGSSLFVHYQPVPPSGLARSGHNDPNPLLRYNSQGGSTCSDLTDGTSLTSATSGSYTVQHEDDHDVGGFSRNAVPVSTC